LFSDWRYEDNTLLFITKWGIDNGKLFVEIANIPNENTDRMYYSDNRLRALCEKVDILCIRGGGKYIGVDARELLMYNKLQGKTKSVWRVLY